MFQESSLVLKTFSFQFILKILHSDSKRSFNVVSSFSPLVTTCHITTFIKHSHRFISGPSLNLHEERLWMLTLRAFLLCVINILPGSCTTQDIIHSFQLRIKLAADLTIDIVNVRASRTCELVTFAAFPNTK